MIYHLRQKIQQQPFIKNVVVILKSSVVVQLLCFALSPILTRLYLPSDFGVFTLYFSLLSIFSIIVALRYDIAIPVPRRNIEASYLTMTSIISIFVNTLLCFLIVYKFRYPIATKLEVPLLAEYLWILPVGLCMAGMYYTCIYVMVRQCRFNAIARAKIFQGLTMIFTQVLGGMMHLRPLGLILGTLFGHFVAVLILVMPGEKRPWLSFGHFSGKTLAKIAGKYWKFPVFSSSASLINSLGMYLPALFIAALYGTQIAGWYGLVLQVIAAPLGLIGQAVGQVYVGQGAKMKQEGQVRELKTLYLKSIMVCLIGALPFILILSMMGPTLFSFIFGENWQQSGFFVQLLGFMLLLEFAIVGPSQNFTLFERQDLSLLWNIIFCALIGLSFLPAFLNQANTAATLLYLSIAKSVGYITMAGLNIYILSGSLTMRVQCAE